MRMITNPDVEYAAELKKAIKDNNKYCLSKSERSKKTKCICAEFKEQEKRGEEGYCSCGLYCLVND